MTGAHSVSGLSFLEVLAMFDTQIPHELFKTFGMKIKVPLQISNFRNVFFHLVENGFHRIPQMKGSRIQGAEGSSPFDRLNKCLEHPFNLSQDRLNSVEGLLTQVIQIF